MDECLDKIIDNYLENEGNVLTILQDIEKHYGYISEDAVYRIASELDIHPSHFFGIASFYSQFHLKPRGKNIITICRGTPCHIKGSEKILGRVRMELDLLGDEDTSDDQLFTLEEVNCVGACGISPVVAINSRVQGEMDISKMMQEINKLRATD